MNRMKFQVLIGEQSTRALELADYLNRNDIVTDTSRAETKVISARVYISDYDAVVLFQEQEDMTDIIEWLRRSLKRPALLLIRDDAFPIDEGIVISVDGVLRDRYDISDIKYRMSYLRAEGADRIMGIPYDQNKAARLSGPAAFVVLSGSFRRVI